MTRPPSPSLLVFMICDASMAIRIVVYNSMAITTSVAVFDVVIVDSLLSVPSASSVCVSFIFQFLLCFLCLGLPSLGFII